MQSAALVSSFSFKVRIVLNSSRMPFVTCTEPPLNNAAQMAHRCTSSLVFTVARVDFIEGAAKPCLADSLSSRLSESANLPHSWGLLVVDPVAGCFPEIVVRLKGLDHGIHVRVVRLVLGV